MLAHEVGHGPRIKRPGAGPHEQAVQRSKAHGRIDAASLAHCTKTRAVPEMCDDDATVRELRIKRPQSLRDEFVREPVESVPSHAGLVIGARQAEAARERTHRVMKRGIKACDLGHVRHQLRASTNSRKIVRLMQRRERSQLEKLLHHLIVDARWCGETVPAVHDTVADGLDCVLAMVLRNPGEKLVQKVLVCELGAIVTEVLVADGVTQRSSCPQMGGDSNLLDLAAKELGKLHTGLAVPEGELETGRPGVESQDVAAHVHSFGLLSITLQPPARAAVL